MIDLVDSLLMNMDNGLLTGLSSTFWKAFDFIDHCIGSCSGSLRLINYKRHRYSSSSPILKGDYRKSALMVCYPAPFPNIRGSTRLNFWVRSWSSFSLNCNLHIPHNAPYLSPKILHKLCFSFLLAITAVPKEIENNAYAKFWGVNQVHFGRCARVMFYNALVLCRL